MGGNETRDSYLQLRFQRHQRHVTGFLDLIAYETPPLISPEEAIGDLRFVLAAYASMDLDGQPVQYENH